MFREYPDIMTVPDAAEALRISVKSVYQLVRNNTLGSKRIGRKILIPKICLIQYVRSAQYTVKL